jgi:hypothetical protein
MLVRKLPEPLAVGFEAWQNDRYSHSIVDAFLK